MSTLYRINGKPATRWQAEQHWLNSASYEMARRDTRHKIFDLAHRTDGGPFGEINWLNEAGITLITDGVSASPSDADAP
jgi:hypothetical protein